MINIVSENNVKNGEIISKKQLELLLSEGNAKIYEVIRVIDGKTVFLKEHYDRMNESIRLSGAEGNVNFDDYKKSAGLLIKENNIKNCNIRVSYYFKNTPITLFYFIESYYPSKELFKSGIHTVTVKIQRLNPNVKAYEKNFKDSVQKVIDETKSFEAILVNDDNTVSEGSKSNVFFVSDEKLITSPDDEVLLGVTRNKVIEVCEKNGIQVEKRAIKYEELCDFDAAFITGTSNDVLPIKTMDDIIYDSAENQVVMKASELYLDEMMKNCI